MIIIPNELKLDYEVTKYKYHGRNEKTGLFAIEWASSNLITLYKIGKQYPSPSTNMSTKAWVALRSICKAEKADLTMYRYGKSKVVHWNTECAKSNADHAPKKVKLLDASLAGLTPCKNCYYRTKCRKY